MTEELQTPCPQCKAPVILAINTQTAGYITLSAVPSAEGMYSLSTEYDGHPRARPTSLKLRFGRTNLYSDHNKNCGARAGAKSKSTRRQGT